MQGYVQTKSLLDDRHQHVDADGNPDLRPHSVFGSAVEALDAQMLFDPIEEQLHLPSAPVSAPPRRTARSASPPAPLVGRPRRRASATRDPLRPQPCLKNLPASPAQTSRHEV